MSQLSLIDANDNLLLAFPEIETTMDDRFFILDLGEELYSYDRNQSKLCHKAIA